MELFLCECSAVRFARLLHVQPVQLNLQLILVVLLKSVQIVQSLQNPELLFLSLLYLLNLPIGQFDVSLLVLNFVVLPSNADIDFGFGRVHHHHLPCAQKRALGLVLEALALCVTLQAVEVRLRVQGQDVKLLGGLLVLVQDVRICVVGARGVLVKCRQAVALILGGVVVCVRQFPFRGISACLRVSIHFDWIPFHAVHGLVLHFYLPIDV